MSARRAELLVLAERLLEEEGVEGFGIGSLARAAGIRPPSLYKHFAGIDDVRAALISRGLRRLGSALSLAPDGMAGFAAAYRAQALAAPQLYRLMTDRPLDRDRLDEGAEFDGMAPLLAHFGETAAHHPLSRSAWAWAHGLVMLEIAERFPPGADIDSAWAVLVRTLSER